MKAEGSLGIIACPILEDEILYCLRKDRSWDRVVLIRNQHCGSIEDKMRKYGIPFTERSEQELLQGSLERDEEGFNVVIWMKDLALHEEPKDLRQEMMDSMLRVDGLFDAIILFYGLCGNGLENIEEWGRQNMRTPVTIIKDLEGNPVDDCISAAIGGRDKYLKLLRKFPGVFYLTPAYATNFDELVWAMEFSRGVERGDMSMLKMLFDMAGYSQVLKIPTGLGDEEEFQAAV
ncbi:MAG: DUF1638 domain-containing protein, partial [Candidatus Methanomethylophilaceae archaeon]